MNKRIASLVIVTGLGLVACGTETTPQAAAPVPQPAPAATAEAPVTTAAPAPAGDSVVVKAGSSSFGQILVDASGNTLYAFTNDNNAESTCNDACADAWPPVIVDASWSTAPGLDAGVFSTIIRADGSEQLTAGRFPLYRFSGDARPGDVNGQASGGVWFVVDTKAAPVTDDAATADTDTADTATTDSATPDTATPDTGAVDTTAAAEVAPGIVTVVDSALGHILVGPDGLTLYGFTKDADGVPTCVDGCAGAWPPVIVDPSLDLTTLPTTAEFSIVVRPDGTSQLKAGKWPLYTFSGDAAAGDVNGQGSGGSWFVVAPDAKLVK